MFHRLGKVPQRSEDDLLQAQKENSQKNTDEEDRRRPVDQKMAAHVLPQFLPGDVDLHRAERRHPARYGLHNPQQLPVTGQRILTRRNGERQKTFPLTDESGHNPLRFRRVLSTDPSAVSGATPGAITERAKRHRHYRHIAPLRIDPDQLLHVSSGGARQRLRQHGGQETGARLRTGTQVICQAFPYQNVHHRQRGEHRQENGHGEKREHLDRNTPGEGPFHRLDIHVPAPTLSFLCFFSGEPHCRTVFSSGAAPPNAFARDRPRQNQAFLPGNRHTMTSARTTFARQKTTLSSTPPRTSPEKSSEMKPWADAQKICALRNL